MRAAEPGELALHGVRRVGERRSQIPHGLKWPERPGAGNVPDPCCSFVVALACKSDISLRGITTALRFVLHRNHRRRTLRRRDVDPRDADLALPIDRPPRVSRHAVE